MFSPERNCNVGQCCRFGGRLLTKKPVKSDEQCYEIDLESPGVDDQVALRHQIGSFPFLVAPPTTVPAANNQFFIRPSTYFAIR